ncbi:MAG TPA: glycogen-binding domain-containing protein [Gemmatimonadales bacterium]|nr:glycogen-binding domain-containing protein [Gemmatimonadales bacterium]
MRMGPVSFAAILALLPPALSAQRQVSLGIGTGVVRYTGGSSLSIVTASPAAQRITPSSYVGVGGGLSLLEHDVWAGQARADIWATLSPRTTGLRLAVSATLAASGRSDGLGAGSGAGLIEAVAGGGALGAGFVGGVIEGEPGVGAFRVRARGWRQFDAASQLSLSAEATRFLGAWYTDLVGGVTVDRPRLVGSLWLSGRVSKTYTSSAAASASLQYFLTPIIAVEASGGNYLRDPFQGLPRAGFAAGAVRIFTARRALTPAPSNAAPSPRPLLQPLVAEHRGDSVVVRFRMPAAHSVAIAGSWNGWTPAPLRGLGDDIWEAALQLAPGTYYFNLVVDGNDWVVPAGVAVISDGMGGLLAVLNVL